MKKTIFILVLSALSIVGFSQSFSYEVKDWKLNGGLQNYTADTSIQSVNIWVGIVGEPYGFVTPKGIETTSFKISNEYGDIKKMSAYIETLVVAWVKTNYPDKP